MKAVRPPGTRRTLRPDRIDLDAVVYGIHAVSEAVLAGEPLRRIHVGEDRMRDPALRRLLAEARERKIVVRSEPRAYFAQFPYKAHQGVVAFAEPFEHDSLEDVLARPPRGTARLIVVLDHITDPHNAGAIIRTAECVGADAVVIPDRRAAGINATVRKSSAGATAHLPIARVPNVAGALRVLKKAGVWVAGAAVAPEAQEYTKADLRGDIALAIGAEDGLSFVARKECDFLVAIPLAGKIDSLNASVAAGILLYEVHRQRQP